MQKYFFRKMKTKTSYIAFFLIIFSSISKCTGQGHSCVTIYDESGVLDVPRPPKTGISCWKIEVPENKYVRIKITRLSFTRSSCPNVYLKITDTKTNKIHTYCPNDKPQPVSAYGDAIITLYDMYNGGYSTFSLTYYIEDPMCNKDSFRCTKHSCIDLSKVCNGVEDCENGDDERNCVKDIGGVRFAREKTVTWLKNQRTASFGWGKNTHRAITALYLAKALSFDGENLEEKLVAKNLELDTSLALWRNSTDLLPVGELSMFVDALTVTCHDPRRFYGANLVQILGERVSHQESPSPKAYLTLCNSNWTLTESDVGHLLKLLRKQSKYPFLLDVQAVTVMALACAKGRSEGFSKVKDATIIFKEAVHTIEKLQRPDGGFGNVYTTALVTQALIASSKVMTVSRRYVTSAVERLMEQIKDPSLDFLAAYWALPVFSGKSLTDLHAVNCTRSSRRESKDDVSDITNKIGARTRIQFSLYVGDRKDTIHTIYLMMPKKSSAYDVMRVAQASDPKYKFHQERGISGHMYVYEISGVPNDPEAGTFWLLHTGESDVDDEVTQHFESLDRFFLEDAEHLIMWYKSVNI